MRSSLGLNRLNGSPLKGLTFFDEVCIGLSRPAKLLPCKYFYDARGSALFDEICELPEYYPTRTESGIMQRFASEMVASLAGVSTLIEYGSGSSEKTRILLDHAASLGTYVPVDISEDHLYATAARIRLSYPHIDVLPVFADYTRAFSLPSGVRDSETAAIYFPGSTIGNFHRAEATEFLKSMAELCGSGGGLLIGVDLVKDIATIERAYNDQSGVTAAFNKNLLHRINTELRGTFSLEHFAHRAFFNTDHSRIEMHLVSERDQEVWVGSSMFKFIAGESIWTESSYKYTLETFANLAEPAGWQVKKIWTDPDQYFSVQYLTVV
jgi:L-histidine N-alpha-methyltransferase